MIRPVWNLWLCILLFFIFLHPVKSQQQPKAPALTIDQIMQGNAFTGTSPSDITWSEDGRQIYFNWNPENNRHDSLYAVGIANNNIRQVSMQESQQLPSRNGAYNKARTLKVYEKNGDIFLLEIKSGKIQQITHTLEREYLPAFTFDEQKVAFLQNSNLFLWNLKGGAIRQLTDFRKGKPQADPAATASAQEKWLRQQQLGLLEIARQRQADEAGAARLKKLASRQRPKEIYIGDKVVENLVLSPDERYVTYRLATKPANSKTTVVPHYVTNSGFTENIASRTKVGAPLPVYEMGVFDRQRDTSFQVSFEAVPGIREAPAFKQEKASSPGSAKPTALRPLVMYGPYWSDNGKRAFVVLRDQDNKDRWLMAFNPADQHLRLLYRQHDDAWVGGPGIGYGPGEVGWLPDHEHVWFQSEESGFSHLYTVNVNTGAKKYLTSGAYEVSNLRLSQNKKYWYFNANKLHPGDVQFYRMPLWGGEALQLTSGTGFHEVVLSPDEQHLAVRYSSSTQPWELYLMANQKGARKKQLTFSQHPDFKAYAWREPEVVSFKAADGVNVYARLYRPAKGSAKGPAVIFVHGAGYLQNAHKWWSQYFREYMFHNFLADQGYTVMDIDYRGSAGYGRDFRTGIYRHMGGKDLSDQVDGARLLVEQYGVDPARIGIYGGSYGGFITLMAMFTQADVFAAGAALRSVTDWAHYNHGYTSNILNEPYTDSVAYAQSSPIYFAEGLKGALLMCHGMVDSNVHFQDIVRLSQRLIELRKENWELAVYPVEDHGFVQASSWADEYKRIFKLFEENLKRGL